MPSAGEHYMMSGQQVPLFVKEEEVSVFENTLLKMVKLKTGSETKGKTLDFIKGEGGWMYCN